MCEKEQDRLFRKNTPLYDKPYSHCGKGHFCQGQAKSSLFHLTPVWMSANNVTLLIFVNLIVKWE